jgi:hypothetical protein
VKLREPAMMSFMITSLGCWICQTKKAVLFRGIVLRAVCCSDTQGWLGFPWPLCLKRGWAKTCATLPWPLSGWSLQFLFFLLRGVAHAEGAGVKAARSARLERRRRGRSLALTQERAQRTLRRLPAGRTAAARGRPGERLPSGAHPRGLPGHGKPSTASRSQHTARQSKTHRTTIRFGWQGSGGAQPPGWTPAHASSTRHTCAPSGAGAIRGIPS